VKVSLATMEYRGRVYVDLVELIFAMKAAGFDDLADSLDHGCPETHTGPRRSPERNGLGHSLGPHNGRAIEVLLLA
jgi:hypothetical protein